jgi:diguanylate cyclase (GGDEF)-like protein
MRRAAKEAITSVLRRHVRPLVVLSVGTLVVLAAAVSLGARTMLASYQKLEDADARRRAEQVYRAFEADLRQLQISNRDYAEWDVAHEFMSVRDPTFLADNFSASQLRGMYVDLVWIIDAAGRDVYSSYVERGSEHAIEPAPFELRSELREFQTVQRSLRERSPAERLVRTSLGLVAASATEIARSDGSSPSGAMLLFARFVDVAEVQRVAETSRLPVTIATVGARSDDAPPPAELAAWLAAAEDPFFVDVLDRDSIAGYSLLRDVDRTPVAYFSTIAPREIHAIGVRTTFYLLGSVVVLFLAFACALAVLFIILVALQRRDVDHRREAEEQQRENRRNLVTQAQKDFLTGLPNRLYVNARVPRLIAKMSDAKGIIALFQVDLDHFKTVNDSRGHASGDKMLRIVARRLRASVAKGDLVARMGGDEFVVVSSLLPNVEIVERLAARLQKAISADIQLDGKPVNVTASMGIALYPRDGVDTETLLKRADIALHQAKESGRRCHHFFAEDMSARISEHALLEQALRRAIGTPEIYLDYQPIIDLKSGRVMSLEALMRWRSPELGQVPPSRFIPIAEKSGLILELGQFALEAVLAQQRAWLDGGVPVVPIAVNVSPLQVERLDFAALVKRLTAAAGLEPKWVRFEITESAVMKEPEKLIATLRTLRELGSQVLIDDFGTGYSSLSYIDRLPVDIIKIDRAFVHDLSRERGPSPVVSAVVDMARRLRLKTVAEGVETAAQAAILAEIGCDYAQGYFYSKPVLARHCRSLLEHLRRERPITDTLIERVVRV